MPGEGNIINSYKLNVYLLLFKEFRLETVISVMIPLTMSRAPCNRISTQ